MHQPDTMPRAKSRSTARVLGSLLAVFLLALLAFVSCVRAYIASAPHRTVDVARADLSVDVPRFLPVTTFGADGTRTQGVWLTLHADGTALALSSREPIRGCFADFRPDQTVAGVAGVYRDRCSDATYSRDGTPLSGAAPRSLDRFQATVDRTTVTVDVSRMLLGTCRAPSTGGNCSSPGAPRYTTAPGE